jgi:hypothetical protein
VSSPCSSFRKRRRKFLKIHKVEKKKILSSLLHAITAKLMDADYSVALSPVQFVVVDVHFVPFRFRFAPFDVHRCSIQCSSLFRPTSVTILSDIRPSFVRHPLSFRSTFITVLSSIPPQTSIHRRSSLLMHRIIQIVCCVKIL